MALDKELKTLGKKQYHIHLKPGDIGKYVLLPGDPARSDRVAKYLDNAEFVAENREHRTFTGYYKKEWIYTREIRIYKKNIMNLLNTKNIYFIPFGQDNHKSKPNSLVAHFNLLVPTLEEALENKQIQPVLKQYIKK